MQLEPTIGMEQIWNLEDLIRRRKKKYICDMTQNNDLIYGDDILC